MFFLNTMQQLYNCKPVHCKFESSKQLKVHEFQINQSSIYPNKQKNSVQDFDKKYNTSVSSN